MFLHQSFILSDKIVVSDFAVIEVFRCDVELCDPI